MFNFTNGIVPQAIWKVFRFLPLQEMPQLQHCTLYGRKFGTYNETTVLHYICYGKQICCEQGNGCCPLHQTNNSNYSTWWFWLVVFGGIFICYFLVWFCKKLGKNHQTIREQSEEVCGDNARSLRSVQYVHRVDRFLEDLIQNCRNRLAAQRQAVENLDEIKVDRLEPPPEYKDALNMPKPQNTEDARVNLDEPVPQSSGLDGNTSNSTNVANVNESEKVPTYEDAIKKL